jgi:DNA-directed RNA polymerase specialized sigma24 family protein
LDDEFAENSSGVIGSLFQQSPQEVGHLIGQLLTSIKPLQRKVIELTFFHGLTADEIAEHTGQTPSVVRHNLIEVLKNFVPCYWNANSINKKEKH